MNGRVAVNLTAGRRVDELQLGVPEACVDRRTISSTSTASV